MNLKITHYNNFFNVKGILDKHSVQILQDEIQDAFEKLQSIIVLDFVDEFDGGMKIVKNAQYVINVCTWMNKYKGTINITMPFTYT